MDNNKDTRVILYKVAYIFMIIITILFSWVFITMAWTIPMTIAAKRAMNEVGTENEKEHITLGVCSLFFVGLVPGILILVASSLMKPNEVNNNNIDN